MEVGGLGIMGKLTKMALVLLYLLQLVVVFREQLTHLYRTAVESVHHQTDRAANPHTGLRAMLERVVSIARPHHESLAAALSGPEAVLDSPHAKHEEHHVHDDDKKDRAKRPKRADWRGYLIGNRWHRIRRAVPTPASVGARAADALAMMMTTRTPSPAA